jgi:FkbM family methyltransferase
MIRETRMVNIKGVPMQIFEAPECISDDIVKYNNFWEYELFNKWYSYFTKDGLMIDIGANIGNHCLQFKQTFPDLSIWAFELHPENYKLLKANVKAYNDVYAFNVGIGSRTSVISFDDGHYSNSGVVKMDSDGKNKNIIIALDDILDCDEQKKPITFIKLDVEGHELSALQGMRKTLLKYNPLIWIEDLTDSVAINYLMKLGYTIIQQELSTSDYLMKKII